MDGFWIVGADFHESVEHFVFVYLCPFGFCGLVFSDLLVSCLLVSVGCEPAL